MKCLATRTLFRSSPSVYRTPSLLFAARSTLNYNPTNTHHVQGKSTLVEDQARDQNRPISTKDTLSGAASDAAAAVKEKLRDVKDTVQEKVDDAKKAVRSASASAREAAHNAADSARDAKDNIKNAASAARDTARETLREGTGTQKSTTASSSDSAHASADARLADEAGDSANSGRSGNLGSGVASSGGKPSGSVGHKPHAGAESPSSIFTGTAAGEGLHNLGREVSDGVKAAAKRTDQSVKDFGKDLKDERAALKGKGEKPQDQDAARANFGIADDSKGGKAGTPAKGKGGSYSDAN